MDPLHALLSVGVAVGALGALALLRSSSRGPQEVRRLRFGTELETKSVEALLTALSGLGGHRRVVLDTLADADGVVWLVRADRPTLDSVTRDLRAVAPGARLETWTEAGAPRWTAGARLRWSPRAFLLRTDQIEASAATLLAALAPLAHREAVLLRWLLRPTTAHRPPDHSERSSRSTSAVERLDRLVRGAPPAPDQLRALRAKAGGPLVEGVCLVAVAAANGERASHLVARVVAVARARRGERGRLIVKRLGAARIARTVEGRPHSPGQRFSPRELAPLLGWPIGGPRLPGVELGTAPLLMPSRRIPERGRVLARATWPGMERPLAQTVTGALSHALVLGPTGTGKSALLVNLIVQDMQAGRGCLVLDGKGDLARDLLARVPNDRAHQVIVLDPAGGGPVPGLRVFSPGADPELAADLVLGVFRDLFADSWGVRSDQWLRTGLVTLAHDAESSLADLPFLFHDAAFRRRLVGRLRDPLLLGIWAAFEAMSPQEQAAQLGAPLNKVAELVGRRVVRSVLAQAAPAIDMRRVLAEGSVVIVSLAPGRIGTPAARLIGALVAHELFAAIQARAALPPERRRPFFAYIDEPAVLGDLPVPLDSLFELGRGLGVGLTLAAQSVSQLPLGVRTAALTNAATLVAFRQGGEDARLLARHLPGLDAEGLQHLGQYEVIARVGLGSGDVAPPVSGRTLAPPEASTNPETIHAASATRHGVDPAEVDRRLAERHGTAGINRAAADQDAPVGRRRRSS